MKRTFLFFLCLLPFTGIAQNINNIRLEEYRQLTEDRVNDLQNYIKVIVDKKLSREERMEAIDLATSLFIEDSKMQVSNINKPNMIKPIPIRAYFNSLLNLGDKFGEIRITNYDVIAVSKFEKGKDGNYHSVATYFQKFEKFDENGRAIYADKTRKDIAVLGKVGNQLMKEDDMKILFGDVTVRETTKINAN